MIYALLGRNLRHQRLLLVALGIGFVVLELLICWLASQIETGPGLAALIEAFAPRAFREMYSAQINMMSFDGMVALGFRHPAVLTASIAFVLVAATLPAGERETGFLDLLLARPLPRRRYLIAVVLTVVAGAVLLPLALLLGAALALSFIEVEGALPWHRYLSSTAALITLLLGIGGYTLWIATLSARRGQAVARAAGITIVLYLVDSLAPLWRPIAPLRWLSPFHYHRPIQAAVLQDVPAYHSAVLLALFAVGTLLAVWTFQRRDL